MDKKRINDFLRGGDSFDMGEFAREVEDAAALREGLRELERMCGEKETGPDKVRMWRKVSDGIRRRRRAVWRRRMGAAAVLAVAIVGAGLWGLLGGAAERKSVPLAVVKPKEQVRLLLADGQVVEMERVTADTLIRDAGAEVKISTSGGADYRGERRAERLVYNTVRVPRGNEFHVVLSEGTEVWLNSESELRFPVNFVGDERRVFLKGEAYFAVSKDAERPFRVVADEMEVEVLGTHFDVNAYRDNGSLLATLVEGSVRVTDTHSGRTCVLEPGYQAELWADWLDTCQVNVAEVVAWRDGRFLFKDMPLERIAKELERWFDIEILFADQSLRKHPFTGVVKRYNTIEEVCALIEETTDVEFVIRDGTVTVLHRK